MTLEPAPASFIQTLAPLLARLTAKRTLSHGKLGVLRHLEHQGRATTTDLASVLHLSTQGISLAARELESMGYVVRVPDTEDRRRIWIELTDAGRAGLHEDVSAGYAWLERAIAEQLTSAERATLNAATPVLLKLVREDPRG